MSSINKIVIAGGSGYLGQLLVGKYYGSATKVVILTRGKERADKNISYVNWDAKTTGRWVKEIDGSDVIFNMTGKSVNCRYNEKNKKEIVDSRVESTIILGKAIQSFFSPPKLWINAGSAAIFGDGGEDVKTETSSLGEGFSAEVCKLWENAFNRIETPKTRKVFLRIGLVFGRNSWVLSPFINLAKWGLGGKIGTGKQYITWIHQQDFLRLLNWIIDREDVVGVINSSAPNPVTNKSFMKDIRYALGVPFGIPHPKIFIQLGAIIIGTESELVLTGRRVVSDVLKEKNFEFMYPSLDKVLYEIIKG